MAKTIQHKKIWGIPVPFTRDRSAELQKALSQVSGGWVPIARETMLGAWQRGTTLTADDLLACFAVYAAITQISDDIGKLRLMVQGQGSNGIWKELPSHPVAKLLKKPNRYQTRQQFVAYWMSSLYRAGNTYALKQRGPVGEVEALYILNPAGAAVLVADDGQVFYRFQKEKVNGITEQITIPASEIIHDRLTPLNHPLVGVSPLVSARVAAGHANSIQQDAKDFFSNSAMPGGILVAPEEISTQTASELKAAFEDGFTGTNSGKLAVVGDGLKFEPLRMKSTDAQLVEQLKLTVDIVCSSFHFPAWKIGFGTMPSASNVETYDLIYYKDCLQARIESMEAVLAEGLGIADNQRIESDLMALLRMDQAGQMTYLKDGVASAIMTPNEARQRLNLEPLDGGDTVYMQQQNYSLEALAKRDAQDNPFSAGNPAPVDPEPSDDDEEDEELDEALKAFIEKEYKLPDPLEAIL